MKIPQMLKSKKFQATVVAILIVLFREVIGLSEQATMEIVGMMATYIFAQGIADAGKEAAKEKDG